MELTRLDLGNSNGRRNLVTFRLDRQTYALPVRSIAQIIEAELETAESERKRAEEAMREEELSDKIVGKDGIWPSNAT